VTTGGGGTLSIRDTKPRGTVTILHAFTLPGEPCMVAAEPRMAQDIADRLAAEGSPCYTVVERWQLLP
jgi:acyl-[acyl carrier protein]--UDP-N-acetylglucosamine O-acyltransferase